MHLNRQKLEKINKIIFLTILLSAVGIGGDKSTTVSTATFPLNSFQYSLRSDSTALETAPEDEADSRRTTALLYSCIMPGSGQTMLGHTYKGVGFTLVAFGSMLTAAISHNNYVARNERLDALEYQYANTTTWISANSIYNDMIGVQKKLVQDRDRRNIFLSISAVVWAVNIVDVLYNTEDLGQELFSLNMPNKYDGIARVDTPHKPIFSLSLPLE